MKETYRRGQINKLRILFRITRAVVFRLLGPVNQYLQPRSFYSIKKGYHSAENASSFDDRANRDEWQQEVYDFALNKMKQTGGRSVIDVGCGSAYKLIHTLGNYNTTGVEMPEIYQWLTQQYPDRHWIQFEFSDPGVLKTDLIICSDVIEHLADPDQLMGYLQKISFRYLVISTPERDKIRGVSDYGPPENPCHFREWNMKEFLAYVSVWFEVVEHKITSDKSPSQILFCRKKSDMDN